MKIRFATREDLPAFVEAGKRVHALTRFRALEYQTERVTKSLGSIIEHPHGSHCFIVAVDSKESPVGWIIGCIERHFFSDIPVASIINYGVLPERRAGGAGLRLLTAFRKWAENRGAVEISAGVNSGAQMETMDRFYKRLGFRLTGGNYAFALSRRSNNT